MTDHSNKSEPLATEQDFPIVGIGASAGGLDAFRQFLTAVPEDSGMAYVLVQHLDPSHTSMLPEILQRSTKIPVHEITNEIHLAPNNIYVIPENKILTSTDGILQLTPRGVDKINRTIDIFFATLAEVHADLAVGVVLSGTGTDGTQGLMEIKAHGGITFAQDQASSAHDGMPESAINAETADFVLPANEIPKKLVQVMSDRQNDLDIMISSTDTDVYQEINSVLSNYSNVDFGHYKESTLHRRIARQMSINSILSLTEYLTFLRDNAEAPAALFNDVLIPVTNFFRDPKVFDELSEVIFPALVSKNTVSKSIRIWSAGCSTGEEPYSLAISLLEVLGDNKNNIQVKIFASDLSEVSMAKARIGFYANSQMAKVPEHILQKYFIKKSSGYQINRIIRDLCVFAKHNFLKDPPFAKMDFISCRNVLIYMDPFLQKKALATFHYALSDGGYLLLGKSEAVLHSATLFNPVSKSVKIFVRRDVAGHFAYEPDPNKKLVTAYLKPKVIQRVQSKSDFLISAESVLLSSYIPASVIINELFEVVQFNGEISPFLKLSSGRPTFNLLKIIKDGLAFELRNAIHKAKETQLLTVRDGIHIEFNSKIADVTIKVEPLANTAEPHFLIIFYMAVPASNNDESVAGNIGSEESLKRIGILEQELMQTHSDVTAVTDELETSNQELQSANEELLSGSEELQSLNEELETSKEELQSTNEELLIINEELINKQEEINASMIYTETIVATLREPIVILDTNLRIKSVNRAFSAKYHITTKEAEGKLIYEILVHLFSNSVMQGLLIKVLAEKTPLDDFQIPIELHPGDQRIMLLNARLMSNGKGSEKLILLAIEDITDRKRAEASLKELAEGFEAKVKERTSELEVSVAALNKANMRLQQFSYITSHDLQEPLRKILIFASILQQEKHKLSETGASVVNKINHATARMKMLINDLLAYSHLGNDDGLYVPVDMNLVLNEILLDFELLIEEKKVDVQSDLLPTINAIPLQMNQLFSNLISNALKFLKKDESARIEILSSMLTREQVAEYTELDQNLSWTEIIFRDNGVGFEQQHALQIFTIFQRLHSADSYEGTGIGLSIASKIVENHNGLIFAKSEEGSGASFHVILPVNSNLNNDLKNKKEFSNRDETDFFSANPYIFPSKP